MEAAASQLGYIPSALASALARGTSHAIGVVAPSMSRWFFATVVEGIHEVMSEHGYDVLLYPIGAAGSPQSKRLDVLARDKRVDGVIGLALPHELRIAAGTRHVPIVTIGTATPGIPGIGVDDIAVGHTATTHLLRLGHRRIAFLGRDPDDIHGFRVADDRLDGYRAALGDYGIAVDESIVLTTGFPVEAGEGGFHELLLRVGWRTDQLPTAVVAVSDEAAFGIIHAARQRGVRVPQDLSVIGVDNHDMSRLFGLTTVAQPVMEQGRHAAALLVDLLRGGTPPTPLWTVVDAELVVRHTTAEPRADT